MDFRRNLHLHCHLNHLRSSSLAIFTNPPVISPQHNCNYRQLPVSFGLWNPNTQLSVGQRRQSGLKSREVVEPGQKDFDLFRQISAKFRFVQAISQKKFTTTTPTTPLRPHNPSPKKLGVANPQAPRLTPLSSRSFIHRPIHCL